MCTAFRQDAPAPLLLRGPNPPLALPQHLYPDSPLLPGLGFQPNWNLAPCSQLPRPSSSLPACAAWAPSSLPDPSTPLVRGHLPFPSPSSGSFLIFLTSHLPHPSLGLQKSSFWPSHRRRQTSRDHSRNSEASPHKEAVVSPPQLLLRLDPASPWRQQISQ